jgi:hypothetical protein
MKGPIRARDLRSNIKDYGYEKGVVVTLELLLDEFTETRQHLRDCVQLIDMCIDTVNTLTKINDGMKGKIEQIYRDMKGMRDEAS